MTNAPAKIQPPQTLPQLYPLQGDLRRHMKYSLFCGQSNGKAAAEVRLALNAYVPAAQLDYPLGYGQSQSQTAL